MIGIDTNIIVRLLTRDDDVQYAKAESLLTHDWVFVPDTVILETVWVLESFYESSTEQIVDGLTAFSGLTNVELENPQRIAKALSWYAQGLDFADALHLAACQEHKRFVTFDKAFIQVAGQTDSNCKCESA